LNRILTAVYLWCAEWLEVGDDGARECGLPVYGGFNVCGGSVYGDVKIVHSVISFRFCCELQFWV